MALIQILVFLADYSYRLLDFFNQPSRLSDVLGNDMFSRYPDASRQIYSVGFDTG